MSPINLLTKLFGNKASRDLKAINPIVNLVNAEFDKLQSLNHNQLREESLKIKTEIRTSIQAFQDEIDQLKERLETQDEDVSTREKHYAKIEKLEENITNTVDESLSSCLPRAFAIMKETARRFTENEILEVEASEMDKDLATTCEHIEIKGTKALWKNTWMAGGNPSTWNMVHYDVQLFGGVALHQGKIAEMATGEGKTLVATLPVFLNALAGRGVHVVTVNDYLAKRDSEWMGPLYQFHGLSVDCIDKHQPNSEERRQAYLADITFGTNNEFGFDYLRDNMAFSPQDLVQRLHNFAIVDEVDSVLIDDARTPLIISGPVGKDTDQEQFEELRPNVERIVRAQKQLATQLLAEAKTKINAEDKKLQEEGALALFRSFKSLPKNKPLIKFLSEPGMKNILQKTENFYMQENSKHMHVATDELFFVIDEKINSIELTDKGLDLITGDIKDPNFFVLTDIGAEIAKLEEQTDLSDQERQIQKDVILQDYAVKSQRVHIVNQLLKAYTLFERDDQYVVVNNKVQIVDEQTGRIMEGRRYSDGLHQAIESKERLKVEAATQTMATITLQNYFRMYHKLSGMTGTAITEAGEFMSIYELDVVEIPTNKPIIRRDLQDKIYKTKREKYNAVIEEIQELVSAGRPVLVGTTSVEISELLSRMLSQRKIKHNVLNAKLHQREADIVAEAGKPGTVTIATNMAGRGTDIKLSDEVKAAGGLAIIGTERHDSRRVDRQLRGRSGRQGDPGSSQFYVSLEDNLMRLFGSERLSRIMDRLGLKDGEVIQHSMISKSIERAQKKVEENNFGIRKNLLEYDDVMNNQRKVIYTKRRQALNGERMQVNISNMIYDTCESLVLYHHEIMDYENLKLELARVLAIEPPFDIEEFKSTAANQLVEKVYAITMENYNRKNTHLAETIAWPVIRDVYENKKAQYEMIVVPFTDGQRGFNIRTNLAKAYETKCKDLVKSFEKAILLLSVDELWKEHLRELDDLRTSVRNATYEQKDPLLIYKLESFELFKTMIDSINKSVVSRLLKGQILTQDPNQIKEGHEQKQDYSKYQERKQDLAQGTNRGQAPEKPKAQPVRSEPKVGRNELCPCGSGKKYKQCHGK